jgi:hypothetical protein
MYIPVLWNQYTVDGHYINYKDNSWFSDALIHMSHEWGGGVEALFQATLLPPSPFWGERDPGCLRSCTKFRECYARIKVGGINELNSACAYMYHKAFMYGKTIDKLAAMRQLQLYSMEQ